MTDPSWWGFVTSPGAGGVAALGAAVVALLGIRVKNLFDGRELARDRAQTARLAGEAETARRWWELAMWTWANWVDLGTDGVLEMFVHSGEREADC